MKKSLGENEINRSVPWGTSAVSKGAHSGVRSLPLRGCPQRGDMVKCGHLRTDGGGIKGFANDRKPRLFIIIVVRSRTVWRRRFGATVLAQDVLAQPQANNVININMRCLSTRGRLMEMTVPTTMLKQLVEDCKQNLEWTTPQFGNL